MLDPQGYITSWNEGARRMKGYEAAEVLGEHYSRFFPPDQVSAGAPALELERARIEGRYETAGLRVRKDGSQFWASAVVTRINDAAGRLVGFSKVTRDLTESKRAEEELEGRERRFRLMISGVKDYAIFMLDPGGHVASWNEGAFRLKGYTEKEILGQHLSRFYCPEDQAAGKPQRLLQTALKQGRVDDEGYRVRKDGSRFWASVVITRVTDSDGSVLGFTKVTRDLTERKRAEEALRAANESLERRVRERTSELEAALKARDEFLSIASHELRTPLTALKLQLQVAFRNLRRQSQAPTYESVAATYDKILKHSLALEELVEDLLDVSRAQSGRLDLSLSDVNVGALVQEISGRFAEQASTGANVFELDVESLIAHWDPRRIGQVLTNLISNAIKYAPNSPIRVSVKRQGTNASLVVEDFGPGIPEAQQAKIFERYERAGASRNVRGLGLGLYITRRIVEAHRGRIHVESELGKGSRFIVELPLTPARTGTHTELEDSLSG
jgi:PAS domain S-box-containing protein